MIFLGVLGAFVGAALTLLLIIVIVGLIQKAWRWATEPEGDE